MKEVGMREEAAELSGLADNCIYKHLKLEKFPTTVLHSKASLPSLSDSRTPLNSVSKQRFLINLL